MKLKKEKGVALTSIIIIILLALVLFALVFLIFDNRKNNAGVNNVSSNISNNTQNTLPTEKNSNSIEDKTQEKINIENSSSTNSSLTNLTQKTTLSTSNNDNTKKYKDLGDSVNVERLALTIEIESVDNTLVQNTYRRAKIKVINNNKAEFNNDMLMLVLKNMITIIGNKDSDYENHLLGTLFEFEDNILNKSVKAGESVEGYIYWQEGLKKADYIKVTPITGQANEEEFTHGEPYYFIVK